MKEIICCLNTFYVMTKNIQSSEKWLFGPPLCFVLAVELEQVWNSFTFLPSSHFIECTWWNSQSSSSDIGFDEKSLVGCEVSHTFYG